MKRILLIAAMLLPLTSAMAAVTITAVDEGHSDIGGVKHATIRIEYSADVNVRAFALDINVNDESGANIGDSIRDFNVGESIAPPNGKKGYGIFPSRFRDFIDAGNPNWSDGNYMPVTAWNEPGAQSTGLGWPKMVVELGTLYSGDGNTPDKSGTLFRFDVNSEGASDCYLRMAVDDLRGGVVDEDAAGITPTFAGKDDGGSPSYPLYIQFAVPPLAPASITYPTTHTTGRYTVSWASSAGATYYVVEKSNNGGAYAPAYTGAGLSFLADAKITTNVFQVKAGNTGGESGYTTGATSTTTYCYGSGVAGYAQWLAVGRPLGWCNYPRQCHGDADGLQEGKTNPVYVFTVDLGILKKAWNKNAAALYLAPDPNANADFSRSDEGKTNPVSVFTVDLGILKTNWNSNPVADCVH